MKEIRNIISCMIMDFLVSAMFFTYAIIELDKGNYILATVEAVCSIFLFYCGSKKWMKVDSLILERGSENGTN